MFFRRFAPGYPRPTPEMQREWHNAKLPECIKPDLPEGEIFKQFIELPNGTISAMILAKRFKLDPFYVRSLCRQLSVLGLLEETPPLGAVFRLNRDKRNRELIERYSESIEIPKEEIAKIFEQIYQ